jgi:predicted anti-sigma-YlaC factor YlaD
MSLVHIQDEDWITLVETGGDAEQRAHVAACDACRATLAEVREGWELAREAEVPEPSPLYWESFRRGVGRRIAQEAPRLRSGPRHVRWALAATVLISLSLSVVALREQMATREATLTTLPVWAPLGPSDEDPGLSVLEGLDVADLSQASCGDVSLCLADASDEDGERVAQELQKELKGRSL